ncbi:uroporphyrinogen decarboxylase/cobalamine-independent methonine synthase family protein [Frondihabitans cladoniiphilus]|uniref:Cobalamin-independent methionine synthase II family protein n=1 Tax=Frondihabitans cladoniiphilus TaxID=715785 RepID=A0ABP8VWW6_9MICO
MKQSTDRILTTHTGSLPRTPALTKLLVARERGRDYDRADFDREARRALDLVLEGQLDAGIDVINDGEVPRVGFSTYVTERMSGFGGVSRRKQSLDLQKFPEWARFGETQIGVAEDLARVWDTAEAQDAVHYEDDLKGVTYDLDLFDQGLRAPSVGGRATETFVSAASPGIVTTTMLRSLDNPAYATDRDYVFGVARELQKEYEYIVSRGHILQLDAPDLAMERVIMFGDDDLDVFLDRVRLHIEAMNLALENIPAEKVRLHVCWGNWQGPHQDDVPVATLLPLLYEAKVGALSIPLGNPRHEHENPAFRDQPLPDGMLLIPGVIDVTTNYLEHPEVVANRIQAAVDAVGDPTRVIAGIDCGLGTFASYEFIATDVGWAKLRALREGADIVSKRIWG